MKCVCALLLGGFLALLAQTPPRPALAPPGAAPIPLDTVVATVDGKKFTAGDMQKLVVSLPQQLQQNFLSDRKEFLRQWALLGRLSAVAEKNKLDQRSPYKERLEYNRLLLLTQAQIDEQFGAMTASAEEQKAYYAKNKDRYVQARVKVIYIPFTAGQAAANASAPKPLTEAEAKEQAEKALAEIRKGADFGEMVKKHSRDSASAAKGGDFGTIRKTDNIPDPVKSAIFALKAGETSAPVRQANGFYLFRAEEIKEQPFEQVTAEVDREVKQEKFKQWFDQARSSIEIKIENEGYFAKPQGR